MMKMARLGPLCLVLLFRCAVASDTDGGSQREETLCSGSEEIYFSCPLENGKTISVCASEDVSRNRGYVKYKYGDKSSVFVYPTKNVSLGDRFALSDVSEGTIRGLHLKFAKGDYIYVISSVWPGEVYVSKNGKIVFDQTCQASRYKSFSNRIFDVIEQTPPSSVDAH